MHFQCLCEASLSNGHGSGERVNILGEELDRGIHFKYFRTRERGSQGEWEQVEEIGRNAAEYCATEGCQQNGRSTSRKQ